MRINNGGTVLLCGLLISCVAIGQTDPPGVYTDSPGSEFFAMLRVGDIDYAPSTFEETVEASTVIAKGNFVDVIPGRSVSSYSMRRSPPMNTVFLKIVPSGILKGLREDYYLVEILARTQATTELTDQLYPGEFLFFLRPASNWLRNADISLSPEAHAEWDDGRPLYSLTMRSSLFVMSGSGSLTSPIEVGRPYVDLYTSMRSLDELSARISAVLAGQPDQAGAADGGSRAWGPTDDEENEPEGLVQVRYENGQLQSETNYFNGKEEGPARYWYESGQLQAEANFENGEPHGPARYWYENGQLAMQATFQDGERVQCRAWTEEGGPADCP